MNRIAYIDRHRFLADEDGVAVVDGEIRDDSQVYLYGRVTSAGCPVSERRKPSFAIDGIQLIALSHYIRQVMLAYRVVTEDIICVLNLDGHVEDRVARLCRVIRSHLDTVHKGRIFGVNLIAPISTGGLTSTDDNGGVVRLGNGEVQGMELGHVAVGIKDSVRIDARGVVILLVLFPEIRIALVDMYRLGGIDLTDRNGLRLLLDHIQDTDAVACGARLRGVSVFAAGGDMVLVPIQRLTVPQHNRLVVYFLG